MQLSFQAIIRITRCFGILLMLHLLHVDCSHFGNLKIICWLTLMDDDCWNSFAYALGLNAANPFSISTVITYLCQLLLNDFYSNLFSKKCRPYSNEKKINLTGIYLSNKKVRSRQFFLKFLWQARSASLWQHFSTFKLCVLEWFNLLLCKKLGVLLVKLP